MENNELLHWGIKGMKWGVRRYQNKDGSLTPAGRKRYDDDGDSSEGSGGKGSSPSTSSTSKPKKLSEMSDSEINALIERKKLENRYKELFEQPVEKVKKESPFVKAGKEIVGEILKDSAKNIGKQAVTYMLGTGANKLLESIAGDANAINPKKGQKDK